MTTSTIFHGATQIRTDSVENASWFTVTDERGSYISVFCPPAVAEATARAFNNAMAEAEASLPACDAEPCRTLSRNWQYFEEAADLFKLLATGAGDEIDLRKALIRLTYIRHRTDSVEAALRALAVQMNVCADSIIREAEEAI